jgi:hypothetical protein
MPTGLRIASASARRYFATSVSDRHSHGMQRFQKFSPSRSPIILVPEPPQDEQGVSSTPFSLGSFPLAGFDFVPWFSMVLGLRYGVDGFGVRLRMTLSQESIERWLVVFRELGFCRFPHDAIVGDDSRSVERSLLDQFPTYPPQKKANKSVEDNGRGGLCRSFHVIRELREVTERRCPPVPPLLRYICASSRAPDPRCSPPRCAH